MPNENKFPLGIGWNHYNLENGGIVEIPEYIEPKKLRKNRKKVKFVSKLKRKFISKPKIKP
jgi:hypothetical protein